MSMDKSYTPKTKVFRRLPKPKHAEEYTTKECARFQPWMCILKVEVDQFDLEPIDYVIFLRALNAEDVQATAWKAFMVWEHLRSGIHEDDYPKVSTQVQSVAYTLTEDQYMEFWKEAQSYPHVATGGNINPTIFRFAKPGWNHRSGIIKPGNASIIVPDKSAIAAVMRTKTRQ